MKLLKRNEVDINTTWDLSDLYKSESDFFSDLDKVVDEVNTFESKYKAKLDNAKTAVHALNDYMVIQEKLVRLSTYASLNLSGDQSNSEAMKISGTLSVRFSDISLKLNFLMQELSILDESILDEIASLDAGLSVSVNLIKKEQKHLLDPVVEDALSEFSQTLNSSYNTYNMHKLVDMKFDSIKLDDKEIPVTFGYFEDELAFSEDKDLRHAAFDTFHKRLDDSKNTVAAIYNSHIQKEKALAKLKGFDSTIDYLLFDQDVSRDMYDRQIDLIMEHLAPAMRKFAKLLQKVHKLDKMTYKDLHLVVDPSFEPDISIEESKAQLLDGLSILGDDYLNMIERAFDERWIDFPQNIGKSTGAFCSSPYGVHPYILISWTHKMREVFVLAHELGHAGHFYLSQKNQNILNTRPSLYFIEAPSTMNELLMANHMKKNADDKRLKRWILSTMTSRTYYHNFVTHLLEAHFQREVYSAVDRNESISANTLCDIFQNTLEEFWGDAVEINDGANLTWMRQPHYYKGLYPYTYSAGLTVATEASKKIINEEISINDWLEVLKAGGTKNPLDLAAMVNVDLSSEEPLLNTIKYISDMIDEIIELTEELDS